MGLLEQLLGGQNHAAVDQISRQFGLPPNQAQSALEALLPAVAKGFQRNASTPQGLEGLLGALAGGQHQRYVEDPSAVTQPEAIAEGNGILGHIFGSKDVSREVAARASAQTGIGTDIIKQMLPMVAALVMGAMARNTTHGNIAPINTGAEAGGLGGLLGGVLSGGLGQAAPSQGGGVLDMLTPFLDADRDGSVIDDLIGKFTR